MHGNEGAGAGYRALRPFGFTRCCYSSCLARAAISSWGPYVCRAPRVGNSNFSIPFVVGPRVSPLIPQCLPHRRHPRPMSSTIMSWRYDVPPSCNIPQWENAYVTLATARTRTTCPTSLPETPNRHHQGVAGRQPGAQGGHRTDLECCCQRLCPDSFREPSQSCPSPSECPPCRWS